MSKMFCFRQIFIFLVMWLHFDATTPTKLTDRTSDWLPSNTKGIIAAFGDFNADRLVDMFVLNDERSEVDILFARQDKSFSRATLITSKDGPIVGVIPSDFNGDAKMDVLLVTEGKDSGSSEMLVYWGKEGETMLDEPQVLDLKFLDHPALIDFNGDLYPDLLGETAPGKRAILFGGPEKNLTIGKFPDPVDGQEEWSAFQTPYQSCAFVDLNSDLTPDLLIPTILGYEFWLSKDGQLVYNKTVSLPPESTAQEVQMVSVADINRNGEAELLVPVCKDNCEDSQIYVYMHNEWHIMKQSFTIDDVPWGFVPPSKYPENMRYIPVSLRLGDYNMDGYPDVIAILGKKIKGKWQQRAVLLENSDCNNEVCSKVKRTFSLDDNTKLWDEEDAVLASFFDLHEDGVLDVLLVGMTGSGSGVAKYPVMSAFKQTSTTDTCFLKVTVTSGLCSKECPDDRPPYGVNQPGPVVRYKTTSVDGSLQSSSATQLTQSSHFALQLPSILFGLGMTPNFVDGVHVGIARNSSEERDREWTQIIPNSQLYIIPYPPDSPSRWVQKLFVAPSRLVLYTGAALLGAFGFVAGIIGILHWKEKREDKKEKRQESHKFHFDAM